MPSYCLAAAINHPSSVRSVRLFKCFTEDGNGEFRLAKWGLADLNPPIVNADGPSRSTGCSARFDEHALWNSHAHPAQPEIQQEVKRVRTVLERAMYVSAPASMEEGVVG
jgi:hypothetical protein